VPFKTYLQDIEIKTGKTPEDFWKIANAKGFVKDGKIIAKHADLLSWLKEDIGLGHGQANAIILYLRMRTIDPKVRNRPD
jgi:hypothetical protein